MYHYSEVFLLPAQLPIHLQREIHLIVSQHCSTILTLHKMLSKTILEEFLLSIVQLFHILQFAAAVE